MASTDFAKFPGKQLVESYFSTVAGLAILLKQVPTTGVFVKISKIVITDIFYVTPLDGCF